MIDIAALVPGRLVRLGPTEASLENCRILLLDAQKERVWYVPTSGRQPVPRCIHLKTLGEWILEPESEDPMLQRALEGPFSPKQQRHIDRTAPIFEALLRTHDLATLLDPAARATIFKSLASLGVTVEGQTRRLPQSTARRLFSRWCQRGMVPGALAPEFHLCGAPGCRRNLTEKPGPIRSVPGAGQGIPNTEAYRTAIKTSFSSTFFRPNGTSLRFAAETFIAQQFPDAVVDRDGYARTGSPQESLSVAQVTHSFTSSHTPEEIVERRSGPWAFPLESRSRIPGRPIAGPLCPGMVCELDATPSDVYVRDAGGDPDLATRPNIYVVKDEYSRMILGIYASPTHSFGDVKVAIHQACTPKRSQLGLFGLGGLTMDPATDVDPVGVPQQVFIDHGEGFAEGAASMMEALDGCDIVADPVGRGDLKPFVESSFRSFHRYLVNHRVPGTVSHEYRPGRRPQEQATMGWKEFLAFLLGWQYQTNHTLNPDLPLTDEMKRAGVRRIPVDMWRWGVEHVGCGMRSVPEETLHRILLPCNDGSWTLSDGAGTGTPRERRAITRDGVALYGVSYAPFITDAMTERTASEARAILQLAKRSAAGFEQKVDIYANPVDVSRILVTTGPGRPLVSCPTVREGLLQSPMPLPFLASLHTIGRGKDSAASAERMPQVRAAQAAMDALARPQKTRRPSAAGGDTHPAAVEQGTTAAGGDTLQSRAARKAQVRRDER